MANLEVEETEASVASIVSNNATASLPSPEEAALQELWCRVFEVTSAAPLKSSVTLAPSGLDHARPAPAPHTGRKHSGPVNGARPPEADPARKRPRKGGHWQLSPSELHHGIYEAIRCHTPDYWISYYLRANNMDVDAALDDVVQHVHWRRRIAKVDLEVLPWGEAGALRAVRDPDTSLKEKKIAEGFLKLVHEDILYSLKKKDHLGRIICLVKVRNHRAGVIPPESYERHVIWHVELSRMMMPETRGDGILLFDCEGHKLNNLDHRPLKIITHIMRDFYPQGLGDVIFHRPNAFVIVFWALLRRLVNEEFHSHVHFTRDLSELQQFIPHDSIPQYLGGGDDTEYRFELPDLDDPANGGGGEAVQLRREYEKSVLQEQHMETADLFEETTKEWINASREGRETQGLKVLREKYQVKLMAIYWKLDPYIRSRSVYDRLGWIKPDGFI